MNNKTIPNNNISKIISISFGHFFHDIYTSFLSIIIAVLKTSLNLSYTKLSIMPIALRLPSLMNPLIGAVADNMSLKYFIIFSPSITAVAMCLLGYFTNYFLIVGLLFIAGISSACFHVTAPVILKRMTTKRTGLSMSLFQIGGEFARTIGPVLIVSVISYYGLKGAIRIIPAGITMSIVLYLLFRKIELKSSIVYNSQKAEKHPVIYTIKSNKMMFIAIWGILLTKIFTASIIANFLPLYLTLGNKSLMAAGSALAIVQFSATFGVLITGTLSDKISHKKILLFLTGLTPLIMLGIIYSCGYYFFVFLILIGLLGFSGTPVILALIQNYGFKYPSVANGIYMTSNFLMTSILLFFTGKISDIIGLTAVFKLCAFASFIGVPFAIFLPGKK